MVKLSLVAALLGLPLLGAAQAPAHRFYLGADGSLLTYAASDRAGRFFTGTMGGPALAAGVYLNSRLSLELGAAYAWLGKDTDLSGSSRSTVRLHVLTLPLLLRYDFLPASRRWHLEGTGGLTLRSARESYAYSFTLTNQPYASESVDYATGVAVTLGPAVRYALSPRLELTAEPLLSAELTSYDHSSFGIPELPDHYDFRDRLVWQFRAGVRYRLGR